MDGSRLCVDLLGQGLIGGGSTPDQRLAVPVLLSLLPFLGEPLAQLLIPRVPRSV
jgi:hypothetical protein